MRAAYGRVEKIPAVLLKAAQKLVTTSIIKSDVVPGLRPGAASLFSGGKGLRGFRQALILLLGNCFVCCNYECTWGPSRSDGSYFRQLPNRRGRESAARAGIIRSLSTGQATNRLFIYKRERLFI